MSRLSTQFFGAQLIGDNTFTGTQTYNGFTQTFNNSVINGKVTIGPATLVANQQLNVTSQATTNIGLVVKGIVSQTANLQEWRESTDSITTAVNSFGQMRVRTFGASVTDTAFAAFAAYTTEKAVVARGVSGQTAQIMEVQDSTGSPLFAVSPYSETWNKGNLYVGSAGNYGRLSVLTGAAVIGAVIRGAVSQTADLTQWQDSAGTSLMKVTSGGSLYVGQDAGGQIRFGGANGRTLEAYQNGSLANFDFNALQTYFNSDFLIAPNKIISTSNGSTDNLRLTTNSTSYGIYINRNVGINTTPSTQALFVLPSAAANVGLTVKGLASQTANLQEWQDSAGSVLAKVWSNGDITARVLRSTLAARIITSDPAIGPLVVQGATSQTANLTEWQDGTGTVKAYVNASGQSFFQNVGTNAISYLADISDVTATKMNMSFNSTSYGLRLTNIQAGVAGLVVKAAASQTGNLQEWQNSSGTARAFMTSSYDFRAEGYGAFGSSSRLGSSYLSVAGWNATDNIVQIRGVASQTGDLTQWQNSAGTIRARIDQDGQFFNTYGIMIGGATNYGATLNVQTQSGGVGAIIRGLSGQTVDLMQWQNNSGTVLSKVDASGQFSLLNPLLTSISTVGGGGAEGGQINFARTTDGTQYWSIDAYGSTSTPDLRVIENVTERFRFVSGGAISIGGSSGTSGQVLTSSGSGSAPTWTTVSGTSSNSFTTIAVPSGTNPAAASSTDTLTFANGSGISITGSSSTDTVTVALATAYGDTINPYASKTANYVLAAPNGSAGVPTFRAIVAADIPTLNQSTTGSAATLTTTRTLWGQNFNGSGNVTGALTDVGNITAAAATAITIKTIDSSSVSTSNVTISTGNSTAAGSTSGAITIDTGTGIATTGSISIGTTNAGSIDIGRTGRTVTVTGTLSNSGSFTTTGSITRTALSGGGATTASFNNAGDLVRTASSARYKQDITDAEYLYDDVLALQPKTFRLKSEVEEDENARIYGGFIAEEVDQLTSLKPFVNYLTKENGDKIPDGIQYGEMVAALVCAIKHQDTVIEDLKARIISLENR